MHPHANEVVTKIVIAPGETYGRGLFPAQPKWFRPDVVTWSEPEVRFRLKVSKVGPEELLLEMLTLSCEPGVACRGHSNTLRGEGLHFDVWLAETQSTPVQILVALLWTAGRVPPAPT